MNGTEKFIHHETRSARSGSPSGGAGHFDIVEDETGPYVSNADLGFQSRHDTVAEAIAEAERLADEYDAKHNMTTPKHVVRKGGVLPSVYLQKDGSWGEYKTARRFSTQAKADTAGRAAAGDNFGTFPTSTPRRIK